MKSLLKRGRYSDHPPSSAPKARGAARRRTLGEGQAGTRRAQRRVAAAREAGRRWLHWAWQANKDILWMGQSCAIYNG